MFNDQRQAPSRKLARGISENWLGVLGAVFLLWGLTVAAAEADSAFETAISGKVGGREQRSGRVNIDLPDVTENGASVLIGISVDSPMSPDDHVSALHLFATENPNPEVATVWFTPASGRAEVILRIRLAKSQSVVAIAEMSDGTVYRAEKYTKVTIGGCGGAN